MGYSVYLAAKTPDVFDGLCKFFDRHWRHKELFPVMKTEELAYRCKREQMCVGFNYTGLDEVWRYRMVGFLAIAQHRWPSTFYYDHDIDTMERHNVVVDRSIPVPGASVWRACLCEWESIDYLKAAVKELHEIAKAIDNE